MPTDSTRPRRRRPAAPPTRRDGASERRRRPRRPTSWRPRSPPRSPSWRRERDQYKDIALRAAGRLRELPQARRRRRSATRPTGPRAARRGAAARARRHRGGVPPPSRRGRAAAQRHARRAAEAGPRGAHLQDQPFDPTSPRPSPTSPATGGDVVVAEVLRSGLPLERSHAAAGDGPHARLTGSRTAMAAQREWFEKDYYKVLGVSETRDAEGDHQGLPQAGARAAPRQEPGRRRGRGALQGGLRGLRRARRRGQAQGVRRGPPPRPDGWRPAGGPGPAGSRSTSTTPTGGLGDLLGQMFGRRGRGRPAAPAVRRRAAARRRRRGRADARLRRRRPRASPPRCTSRPTPQCTTCHGSGAKPGHGAEAVPAVRRPRRHRRQPGPVLVLLAVPALRRGGHRDRGPVPDVPRHAASRSGPARCRRASPPACPTARRSGSRAAARPGRNGGPAGDLLVEIHVAPHPLFGRDGNDLTRARAGHVRRGRARRRHRRPDARRPAGHAAAQARHAAGQPAPGEGQGHRRPRRAPAT